jgi:hypothetical protein
MLNLNRRLPEPVAIIIIIAISAVVASGTLVFNNYDNTAKQKIEEVIIKNPVAKIPKTLVSDVRRIDLNKFAIEAGIVEPQLNHEMDAPQYADLDGDGSEEAIFTVSTTGTSGSFGPFVVALRNGVPAQLKLYDSTTTNEYGTTGEYWGGTSFFIIEDKLVEYFPLYQSNDSNCCPSAGLRYVLYEWENSLPGLRIAKAINLGPEWIKGIHREANQEAVKELGL